MHRAWARLDIPNETHGLEFSLLHAALAPY
jgi:hypothetical protein